jgi:hypothetical protein
MDGGQTSEDAGGDERVAPTLDGGEVFVDAGPFDGPMEEVGALPPYGLPIPVDATVPPDGDVADVMTDAVNIVPVYGKAIGP